MSRVSRVGDRGFAPQLEDQKLLYVSLEILLLTTSGRSRTLWAQLLRKGGQVRTALCEIKKTKIKVSGHPAPQTEFSGSSHASLTSKPCFQHPVLYPVLYPRHQYVFFETPKRSMWWIDGDGVAQRILNVPIGGDLT